MAAVVVWADVAVTISVESCDGVDAAGGDFFTEDVFVWFEIFHGLRLHLLEWFTIDFFYD